jgi:hypothetical protein
MRSDVRGSPVGQEIGEERFSISFFGVAQKLASLDLPCRHSRGCSRESLMVYFAERKPGSDRPNCVNYLIRSGALGLNPLNEVD